MKALTSIALILLIIGGLNWGLVGLFSFDVVAALFGGSVGPRSSVSNLIYIIVGLAAVYGIVLLKPINDRSEPTVRSARDTPRDRTN